LQAVFSFGVPIDQNGVGVAIHSQSGPNGCSTKLAFNSSGGVVNNVGEAGYSSCSASTVPEPATIGLVTTGLLGLGGAGFLRRRKKV
ncbi:MAG: PEP-CTERM sorting domain-containing protein, partial [Gemmatimonadales bacterium]